MKYAALQNEYKQIQQANPAKVNLKHMIERDSFFVYGTIQDKANKYADVPLLVAAYSNSPQPFELVDSMEVYQTNTHYGLNLPEGAYTLVVFADINKNNLYEGNEASVIEEVNLTSELYPDLIVGQMNLALGPPSNYSENIAISYTLPAEKKSVFYPTGSIRSLDDVIFSPGFSTLGMYDPASFLEQAPTMFYALEEDLAYKIPVVFVHGIGGSAKEFEPIVDMLDLTKFKPWFFHYPSGADLNQLASMFHQIFLSGNLVLNDDIPMIVVAHSMGGLVVREAINLSDEKDRSIDTFVSIASPFGGHEAAAKGEKNAPLVLPSWRNLNPSSPFISELYRQAIHKETEYYLLYAFKNEGRIKLGANSDGVVSLDSQLRIEAQGETKKQLGFNATHTSILQDPQAIDFIVNKLDEAQSVFPDDHIAILQQERLNITLDNSYTPRIKYLIEQYGKYLLHLANGELTPFDEEQRHFIDAANGIKRPKTALEHAWIRFVSEHPELTNHQTNNINH